jgi:recombination protein RecR
MTHYSKSFKDLVEQLKKMPGIGQKSAERLALYVVSLPENEAEVLADTIQKARKKRKYCKICNNISDEETCQICTNTKRNTSVICVVEQPSDVIAIEKSGAYNGLYHVLMGKISPLDGIKPSDIKIEGILKRIEQDTIKEVIIATSSDTAGQITALYIGQILKGKSIKVSRIAHGIPIGISLEYTDQATIAYALKGRQSI